MKTLLFAAAATFCCLSIQARTALVVIAHGSPSERWNQEVLALESRLSQMELPGIDYKRVALMEFARPDIPSVIRDCEQQQIDTIFALPLFIAPSGHSEDDIPNILGLKYDPAVRADLAEEGAALVRTPLHIIVGPTLMHSGVIEKAMAERIRALSTCPDREAVILLAHGDAYRNGMWKTILERCANTLRTAGFSYVDYQLVGMGQNFAEDVPPLLTRAEAAREQVIVQGIYLVSTVGSMARMAGMAGVDASRIVYSEAGILPESSDDVLAWIVKAVEGWRGVK